MKEEFKKWLQKEKLYQYYFDNPNQQKQIYSDYLLEKRRAVSYNPKLSIDEQEKEFAEYALSHPELVKKEFPDYYNLMIKTSKKLSSIQKVKLFQNFVNLSKSRKNELSNLEGKTKDKKLKDYIEAINIILNFPCSSVIEVSKINEVKEELLLELDFLKKELNRDLKEKNKATLKQVALICVYKKVLITRGEIADVIAKKYGFNSKTSGEKLYQHHTKFVLKINRIGQETTLLKTKKKHELLKSVKPFLENEELSDLEKELQKLNKVIQNML